MLVKTCVCVFSARLIRPRTQEQHERLSPWQRRGTGRLTGMSPMRMSNMTLFFTMPRIVATSSFDRRRRQSTDLASGISHVFRTLTEDTVGSVDQERGLAASACDRPQSLVPSTH